MRTINKALRADTVGTSLPAAGDPVEGPELVERIMADFHVAIREIRGAGTERLIKAGVSMTHLHVMDLLSRYGETSMSRIAELLDVSLSNATGLIDRMAERGLVERVRVPDDRRVVLVRLTDGGRTQLEALEILKHDLIKKILARMDAMQLERLSQSLSDVHEAVSGLIATEGTDIFGTAHDHPHTQPHAHAHAHPHSYPEADPVGRTVVG